MTDEHEKDFDKIERLSHEFTKKWESFFNGIWEEVKESTTENIEYNIKKAWQKQDKEFYIHYIKKAYDIGEKRAKSIIEQVFTDEENNVNIRIGIEREDIQEELLNNALLKVSKMEQTTIDEIRKILAKGYEQGESWKEQKKNIEKKIKNPVRAEMIAITELGFAYNTSTKNTYRGAGASKVAWHASLDLKTCDGCRALHGKVFDVDKAPDNPLHPRCRCTWLPVFSERKVGNFDNSSNMQYNNSEKQNTFKGKKREQNNEVYNIRIHKNVSEKEVEREIEIVKETFAEMPEKVQKTLRDGTIIEIGQEGTSQYDYNNDVMYIAKGANKKQVRHETGHMIDNKLMNQQKVEQLKRDILGEVTIDDIYIDTTTYTDNLDRPVKVCFLKNEALLTEYQGRVYHCESELEAFYFDGEFKYEKMWDFISEPYELYFRDATKLQRECPKLYEYIKEVIE